MAFMDFNGKSGFLHQTLRFKAKKVTPNQLFAESHFCPKAVFSAKADFCPKSVKCRLLGKKC